MIDTESNQLLLKKSGTTVDSWNTDVLVAFVKNKGEQ